MILGVCALTSPSGGTTACVVAGRLAEADPSLRILVSDLSRPLFLSGYTIDLFPKIIEAGSHTLDNTLHTQPAQFLRNLVTPGDTFSHHAGAPSEALDGRSAIVQTGRCMGGGSGVNCKSIIPVLRNCICNLSSSHDVHPCLCFGL